MNIIGDALSILIEKLWFQSNMIHLINSHRTNKKPDNITMVNNTNKTLNRLLCSSFAIDKFKFSS
jgi:hypothetical protein